jgi:hypothetical protein
MARVAQALNKNEWTRESLEEERTWMSIFNQEHHVVRAFRNQWPDSGAQIELEPPPPVSAAAAGTI